MASTTTRDERAQRWRTVRTLAAATLAVSTFQLFCAAGSMAQVKAPSKNQLRAPTKAAPNTTPNSDVQPFSIGSDGLVIDQLVSLKVDPADAQAASEAVGKALGKLDAKVTSSGRATLESQGANMPKRLVALQLYSASSLAVELHRAPDGTFGFKRVSTLPSMTSAAGPGARSIVAGSVTLVKASGATLGATLAPAGANPATLKELTQALGGFAPASAKVEVFQGRTVDGTPRILLASLGDGKSKQSFWWFAPPDQPEGWFDEQGRRLGGTALAEPRPEARVSSPFGTRRYYGRKSGGGFHNGIDFEGKNGEPIYAAADGTINHQGWYFNYGRTVKISHADNFESLYAHMSRFADGMGPGSRVRKGDLIGYVGSTGRSTGSHLHFSVIVNGQFVDPAPYISEKGGNTTLNGEALVAYRQWQQDVRNAGSRGSARSNERYPGLQGAEPWSRNPFGTQGADRL
jgi:murein DD-endopeptidase MepM/ murein hydrolase activator NlpD